MCVLVSCIFLVSRVRYVFMRVPRVMRVLRGVLNAVFRTKLLFAVLTYVEYNLFDCYPNVPREIHSFIHFSLIWYG